MRITIRHQDHCHYHTFTTTFPSLAVLNILDQHARCQIRTTVCTYRSTQNRIEVLFIKILPVQSARVDTEVSIGSDPTYRVVMSACFQGEYLLGVFSPLIHHVHLQFTQSVYKHLLSRLESTMTASKSKVSTFESIRWTAESLIGQPILCEWYPSLCQH